LTSYINYLLRRYESTAGAENIFHLYGFKLVVKASLTVTHKEMKIRILPSLI